MAKNIDLLAAFADVFGLEAATLEPRSWDARDDFDPPHPDLHMSDSEAAAMQDRADDWTLRTVHDVDVTAA